MAMCFSKIRLAPQRRVEARQRRVALADPVLSPAKKIVCPRVMRLNVGRLAEQVDRLGELPVLTEDEREVTQCVGVAWILRERLRIGPGGLGDGAGPVESEALFDKGRDQIGHPPHSIWKFRGAKRGRYCGGDRARLSAGFVAAADKAR